MNHPRLEFSDIHLVSHDLGESSDKIVFFAITQSGSCGDPAMLAEEMRIEET